MSKKKPEITEEVRKLAAGFKEITDRMGHDKFENDIPSGRRAHNLDEMIARAPPATRKAMLDRQAELAAEKAKAEAK